MNKDELLDIQVINFMGLIVLEW